MNKIQEQRDALIAFFQANNIDCPHKAAQYFEDYPPKNEGENIVRELNDYYLMMEQYD